MTNNNQYIDLFHSLIQHTESEVVEFKKAERNFDFDDLGEYFSALSNEANLRGLERDKIKHMVLQYIQNAGADGAKLDAIQKGHRIDEEIAQDLLKRGLIEGEAPNYTISISVAKASKQLPGYTKAKGLEK